MKKIYLYKVGFVILFVTISFFSKGQGYFEITPEIRAAYSSVSKLKITEAKQILASVKESDPQNMMVYYVENYIDFFDLFINENKDTYDRIKKNKDLRLEKIKEGDPSSPYYRFCIAEVNLQWATARLKFGEKLKPLREVYYAYNLLKENSALHPTFQANKKSLSIIHALGESLPGLVKTLFNIEGSIIKGTQEIADLVQYSDAHDDFMWREECYAIYSYILFYQNNKRVEAYDLLSSASLDVSTNPLLIFLKANIAQKTGHNEEALQILESRPVGDEYMPFHYLDFMYGKFLLYRLDPDAQRYMQSFIDHFEGEHFIKEAYQKMAWYALVADDNIVAYKKYMSQCNDYGNDLVDEDKQALYEAKSKQIPNSVLLKARLLYDGGYFTQAYEQLILKAHLFTKKGLNTIEFHYRMGRVSHALGNLTDAINYYLKTIDEGEDIESYYACNAALQIGLILESQHEYKKAKQLFERCLSIEPKEYKSSLHQKAESGIERADHQIKNL